jgi:hypothetical protein
LYERCGAVARLTPQQREVKAMGNTLFEWTYQVSKRSPLIRALKNARILPYLFLSIDRECEDMDGYIGAAKPEQGRQ